MLLEQLLDLGQVRPAVDPAHDLLLDHEYEARHLIDDKPAYEARMLVCIHAPHAQAVTLLTRDMREQTLHPARRAGCRAREEDQHRGGRVAHYCFLLRSAVERN
jgi:hypothetical protein